MNWDEKLDVLADIYGARGLRYGVGTLNESELTLFCVRPFTWEMVDGSFWAFFYNSTGEFANETADALARIGARVSASLLRQAIRIVFGEDAVPRDTQERRRLMAEVESDVVPELTRVDGEYFAADEPFEVLLVAYVQANEQHLRITEEEAATVILLEGDWRQCTKCHDAWELPPAEKLAHCPGCGILTMLRDAAAS